jgi:hypothetical protein
MHLLASACHPAAALLWLFHTALLLLRPQLLLPVLLLSVPWQLQLQQPWQQRLHHWQLLWASPYLERGWSRKLQMEISAIQQQ